MEEASGSNEPRDLSVWRENNLFSKLCDLRLDDFANSIRYSLTPLLNLGSKGNIQIIPSKILGKYFVAHIQGTESSYLSDVPISISWATGIAESEANVITRGSLGIALKDAKWRLEPATHKQLRILRKYNVDYDRSITKGEAYDVINVIFAGEKVAAC